MGAGRHVLAIRDMLNMAALSNVLRIRGPPNYADGSPMHKSDLVPLLAILMKGEFHVEERGPPKQSLGRIPASD